MMFKLIALDLDGTLLDGTRGVSEANRQALRKASSFGIKIMISSGRILPESIRCVDGLDSVSLVSACNGAIIHDVQTDTTIHRHPLDWDICLDIVKKLSEAKMFFTVYGEDAVFLSKDALERFPSFAPFVEGMSCRRVIAESVVEAMKAENAEPYKIFAMSLNRARMGRLRFALKRRKDIELSSSYRTNFEITAKGVDKGSALRVVGSAYGIGPEEMIAMGDGENDIPMLEVVGLPVAMGNALSVVKRVAKYTTATNAEDGVAKAMERYVLAED